LALRRREYAEFAEKKGFDPGPIDGGFGPKTQAAPVAFQLSEGLVADGEVGQITACRSVLALSIQHSRRNGSSPLGPCPIH
jgi:peptidoglycan hydrolase-like protein with peptidoglycan-binding domain